MGIIDDTQEVKPFKLHCEKPYDRHHYKVVYDDGTYQVFDNYEEAQVLWWNRNGNFLSHIEVIDIKKKTKGFK
jgi:hypothetical protein